MKLPSFFLIFGLGLITTSTLAQVSSVEMARMARQNAEKTPQTLAEEKHEQVRQALYEMGCPAHISWLPELSYWGNEDKIPWRSRQQIVITINAIDRDIQMNKSDANMNMKKAIERNNLIEQLSLKGSDLGGMQAVQQQIQPVRREREELIAQAGANTRFANCLSEFRENICKLNASIPEVASACSGKFSMPEDIFQ